MKVKHLVCKNHTSSSDAGMPALYIGYSCMIAVENVADHTSFFLSLMPFSFP